MLQWIWIFGILLSQWQCLLDGNDHAASCCPELKSRLDLKYLHFGSQRWVNAPCFLIVSPKSTSGSITSFLGEPLCEHSRSDFFPASPIFGGCALGPRPPKIQQKKDMFVHRVVYSKGKGRPYLKASFFSFRRYRRTGWWFGTFSIFPYIGNNHPNWLSYFSEGFKPPTS